MPEPATREELLATLQSLALEGPSIERLSAARDAIARGLLGSARDVALTDASGRAIPLLVWSARWGDLELVKLVLAQGADVHAGHGADGTALHAAAERGDLAMCELLLAHGASPLALRHTGESVLRAAHPHGRSLLRELLRRAARAAAEPHASTFVGLATLPSPRRYVLRTDRGALELRHAVQAQPRLDVVLVASDVKTTVRALGNLVQAARREADVARRPVEAAQRLAFVYRLNGLPWTIVPLVFEVGSPWRVEHVRELAAPGTGIAPFARALAGALSARVIHLEHDTYTFYFEHGGIERRTPEAIDDELAAMQVLVPPMRVRTDGYHVQLEVTGIEPSEVERVDVVVLQEHGDPDVDRTVARPTAAPALLGGPVAWVPGQPALVSAPEPRTSEPPPVVSAPASAPPRVSAPPPLVVEAPSPTPPMVRPPPPMVVLPVTPAAESDET